MPITRLVPMCVGNTKDEKRETIQLDTRINSRLDHKSMYGIWQLFLHLVRVSQSHFTLQNVYSALVARDQLSVFSHCL